jgi:hypothetical protein
MDDLGLKVMQRTLNRYGYKKYCVWADDSLDAAESTIQEYYERLDSARDEKPLQIFLTKHPAMLVAEDGSECRWVIPQMSLGRRFFPDFLVGRLDSLGLNWKLVELQSPRAQLFTKYDRPADQLREGIEQVQRWRRWLMNNRDIACRSPAQDGLGLVRIDYNTHGLIIIGRASDRDEYNREHLLQLSWENHISIRSYDWLAREARGRIATRHKYGSGECRECQKGDRLGPALQTRISDLRDDQNKGSRQ